MSELTRAQAKDALIAARDALLKIEGMLAETQDMLRRNNVVFDKWPPEGLPFRWTRETVAALDPEVRWQGVAFSIYCDLVEAAQTARHALSDEPTDERRPVFGQVGNGRRRRIGRRDIVVDEGDEAP